MRGTPGYHSVARAGRAMHAPVALLRDAFLPTRTTARNWSHGTKVARIITAALARGPFTRVFVPYLSMNIVRLVVAKRAATCIREFLTVKHD